MNSASLLRFHFHMRILCISFQNSAIPRVSANSARPLHSRGVNPTSAVPFVRTPCLPASSVTLAVMREAGTWQYVCPSILKDGHGSPESMWLGELPVTLSTLQAISTAPPCGKANTCTPGRPPGVDSLMDAAMLRPMAMSCVSMVTLQFMTYGLDPTPAAHQPVTFSTFWSVHMQIMWNSDIPVRPNLFCGCGPTSGLMVCRSGDVWNQPISFLLCASPRWRG